MANPTTNYSFAMPTNTDLVKDLPADFDIFGQAVDDRIKALNPETTLGDIAYRSATANTNTRLAIGTTGQILTVAGGVPSWASSASATYAVFIDEKTNGTAGGTQTSGSFLTRDLNTTQFNNITGASLSSNQVTLAAGTYYVDAIAPQKGPQGALRWYNITDSSVAVAGQTHYFEAWGEFKLFGYFTIAAQKVFQLQYRSSATEAGNGLGVAKSFSIPEVYAMVSLVKVA
jgi:hypothetical protein